MKERILKGQAGGFRRLPRSHGRVIKVSGGFRHPPKHQPDAHPGTKQHGKPRDQRKLRLFPILSQGDISISRKNQRDCHDQKPDRAEEIEPPERIQQPALDRGGDRGQLRGSHGSPDQECRGNGKGDLKDRSGGFHGKCVREKIPVLPSERYDS